MQTGRSNGMYITSDMPLNPKFLERVLETKSEAIRNWDHQVKLRNFVFQDSALRHFIKYEALRHPTLS